MGRFIGLEWNGMKYGVFFQLCLGLYKTKNGIGGGGGGGIKILACLSLFICLFKNRDKLCILLPFL